MQRDGEAILMRTDGGEICQLGGVRNVECSDSEPCFLHAFVEQTHSLCVCCCCCSSCLQMMAHGSFSLGVGNGGNVGAHGGDQKHNSCVNSNKHVSISDKYK